MVIATAVDPGAKATPAPQTGAAPGDNHVFLIGRPPIGEFLGFIRTMAADGGRIDQAELTRQWRAANDHVLVLERTEAGAADNPGVGELAPELRGPAKDLLVTPDAQRAFRYLPTSIQMVELDKLVVFQKYINLEYVEHLKAGLGRNPTPERVFRLALPTTVELPPVQMMQNAQNVFSFIAPSNDYRFLEAEILSPDQLVGFTSTGRPTAVIALVVGYGSNFLNVMRCENRLVLNNGSHRAYALRELGITHAPCLGTRRGHAGKRPEQPEDRADQGRSHQMVLRVLGRRRRLHRAAGAGVLK